MQLCMQTKNEGKKQCTVDAPLIPLFQDLTPRLGIPNLRARIMQKEENDVLLHSSACMCVVSMIGS